MNGLLALHDITVKTVQPRPPNVLVEGFLPLTPTQFLEAVDRHRGWRILFSESEVREAEAMFTNGRHRNFWKVVLACRKGSRFVALVGDEPRGAGS